MSLSDFVCQREDVQASIHAKRPVDVVWAYCSLRISKTYVQLGQNMLDYYNKFFEKTSWRILVFSGDVDISTVPHAYTQICLSALNRPVKQPWSRWTVPGPLIINKKGQTDPKSNITAGYQEVYDKYSFATVR